MINHIGKKIKEIKEARGITISEFSRRINCSRENVYGIFKRQSVDTTLLSKIGEVLQHDFFQYFTMGDKNINKISTELEKCKQENQVLKKEVDYLKKINGLLERRKNSSK